MIMHMLQQVTGYFTVHPMLEGLSIVACAAVFGLVCYVLVEAINASVWHSSLAILLTSILMFAAWVATSAWSYITFGSFGTMLVVALATFVVLYIVALLLDWIFGQ